MHMKKLFLPVAIFIASISLAGIVVTQLFWVKEAIKLKEEEFANSVVQAMKSVTSVLWSYHYNLEANTGKRATADSINIDFFNSLVRHEVSCLRIDRPYYFAIVKTDSETFIAGDYAGHEDQLLQSVHKIPLTGFPESATHVMTIYFEGQTNWMIYNMLGWLILSVIFAILLILTFYFTVNFFLRQKKLAELKTDFINNMTHEFRTPIATISLTSEMLMNDVVRNNPERTLKYAMIIHDENTRLQNQVEQVLTMSLMGKMEIKIRKREVDIHKLILREINNFNLKIKKRKGSLESFLNAKDFIIIGDKEHLSNVIANLLDNAIKYSRQEPEIIITTRNVEGGILISVEDKGIGISKDNQKMVFKRLYRVQDEKVRKEKGYGLGLHYVRKIIEAHEGNITLTSELNKGSRFNVYLPFGSKNEAEHDHNE